jgi:hypothetical protein
MKRIALIVASCFAGLMVFATPASAHNDSCTGWSNTACDVVMVFEGSYIDITSRWCETSGGWIDVASITIDEHFGASATWRPVLFRTDPAPEVVWEGDPVEGDGTTVTWHVGRAADGYPDSFPKLAKGSGLYLRFEMDPTYSGVTQYWRQTPLHDEPPHAPYGDVGYSNEFSNGTYDCSL